MDEILVGVGRHNINPVHPVSLAGYFNARTCAGVLDDIEVRALVIEQGDKRFALLQFDLVTISSDFLEIVRSELSGCEWVGVENSLITATHTHTAPEVRSCKPAYNRDYCVFAAECAAEALSDACKNLQKAKVFGGTGTERRFAFNRRYWMTDGTVCTNPPRDDRSVLMPEGVTDFEIPLLVLERPGSGNIVLASICNHADTIGGAQLSGDWPGILRRRMEQGLPAGSMLFPLIGTCGNLNHFDRESSRNQTCYDEALRLGGGYAEAVGRAMSHLTAVESPQLRIGHVRLKVPPREIECAEIAEAEKTIAEIGGLSDLQAKSEDITSEDLAKGTPAARLYFAEKLLEVSRDRAERIFDLTGFSLGTGAVVSLPGEPFVEIGLALRKEHYAGKLALVATHANGTGAPTVPGGYIPNKWNFGRGGYETAPRSSQNSTACAELLLEASKKLRDIIYPSGVK